MSNNLDGIIDFKCSRLFLISGLGMYIYIYIVYIVETHVYKHIKYINMYINTCVY